MQVLSLSPEQLNQLPPKERDQIMQLVSVYDAFDCHSVRA